MPRFRIFASVSAPLLTRGVCAFGYAQDNQSKNKDKRQNPDKPASPGNQARSQTDGQRSTDQPNPGDNGLHTGQQKQMERSQEQERDQPRTQERAWQERRANHWEFEGRSWRQRGGYNGYRFPDDVYVAYQGDGYYLFHRSYPGPLGIALSVYF